MILSELPTAEEILINMIFELENKMRQVVLVKYHIPVSVQKNKISIDK